MTVPIVHINDLYFYYNAEEILHGINITVNQGDFVAIIGPNGGGKTTLIKLILGLLKPSRGTIRIGNQSCRESFTVIGYVPQNINHNFNFPASAIDVVLMGKYDPGNRWQARDKQKNRGLALESLDKLGMADYANRKITDLSAGQRQRVLIARALVINPELLVLDEPTASLDTRSQTDLLNLLQELNRDLTILLVSHDLLLVSSYAKSIACVNKRLHYHQNIGSTGELMNAYYSCSVEEVCPVEHVIRSVQENPPKSTRND